ncbi:MAG: Lrp/AsnC family transcriptional regulator [Oscillospiraceae bacterium]
MDQLLTLLEQNARLSNAELAVMLGRTEEQIAQQIEDYQARGIIRGFQAMVDWEQVDRSQITAYIELNVTPKQGEGFEEIAKRIMQFEEVQTVYLMSGSYDLQVVVQGKSFKDVALFVAERLSPLESVTSTSTSFVLRKYKDRGVIVCDEERDERGLTSL